MTVNREVISTIFHRIYNYHILISEMLKYEGNVYVLGTDDK